MVLPVLCCYCSQITPAKNGKPVQIELVDTKTKETKDVLEVLIIIFTDNSYSYLVCFLQSRTVFSH
jgi:hypothetical protein